MAFTTPAIQDRLGVTSAGGPATICVARNVLPTSLFGKAVRTPFAMDQR